MASSLLSTWQQSIVWIFQSSFPCKIRRTHIKHNGCENAETRFQKYTGRFSLGLLCGNAYISGPIRKERTSFSFALRRSWVDLLSLPTLAIINATKKKQGLKHIAAYNFMDINARVDHRFNSSLTSSVVGYYGHDYMKSENARSTVLTPTIPPTSSTRTRTGCRGATGVLPPLCCGFTTTTG